MGTNPAVHIANYFLFYYELAFMNRLVDLLYIDTLKSLLRTKRYRRPLPPVYKGPVSLVRESTYFRRFPYSWPPTFASRYLP